MKFWNRRREVRLRCWTRVKLHLREHEARRLWMESFEGFLTHTDFMKLKVELQNNSSKNKFYMHVMRREIWFESAKDAVWFALTHSNEIR